jgi:hypothetical protein
MTHTYYNRKTCCKIVEPVIFSNKIICTNRIPVGVALTGMDELGANASFRGYTKSAILQTHSVVTVNSLIKGFDVQCES